LLLKDNWQQKAALFLLSQMVSIFGTAVVAYAVIWYITLETSSAGLMTILIICTFLPQILISLVAGVWADRYNRKKLIIFADLFTAVVTLIMAICFISGNKSFTLIFVASALRSLGAGIQMPAVSAILPQIVPMEKLTKVNGVNNSLNSAMTLLSPAVGGLMLATIGFSYTLLIDVFTALIAIIIFIFIKVEKHTCVEEAGSVFKELRNGLLYTKNHLLLRRLLIFYALFFFLLAPAAFLTPLLVVRSFGPEVWRLTLNEMFWSGGAVLGGLIISVWGGFKNRISTMALATAGFGITIALMGIVGNFQIYLAIMLISGLFMPFFGTAETVLIQENVEEHMLGRVFSIVQIIVSAALPLGMLLFGPLGDMIAIEYILIATGICLAFLTLFIIRMRPAIKDH